MIRGIHERNMSKPTTLYVVGRLASSTPSMRTALRGVASGIVFCFEIGSALSEIASTQYTVASELYEADYPF